MSFRSWFPKLWFDSTTSARHHETNKNKREQICGDIDANGFDWQIWAVAGSGFFTDSYNLFATNVILPSLAFVYWHDDLTANHETNINAITLAGSIMGQLLFGFLADRYGRRKMYGLELLVVIFGTLGLVQCSAGYNGSMNILGWIMFWRWFIGCGIGAEYPLSAVITAEFAPRRARARMMAAVFIMQPLGQLMAYVVGLAVLLTVGRSNNLHNLTTDADHEAAAKIVDRIWRYVIGVGAIPALVAILFRLTIPESPRYTLDVDQDGARALRDTQVYYNIQRRLSNGHGEVLEYHDVAGHGGLMQPERVAFHGDEPAADEEERIHQDTDSDAEDSEPDEELPDPFSRAELKRFFWEEGNIKYLMGTSLTWFLLDFAFYGLGINNPRVIAQIWSSTPVASTITASNTPDWANPSDPGLSVYDTLKQDGIRSIITVSVGSLLGSIILIKAINYIPRKAWLAWSFVGMTILFAVVGGSYFKAANTDLHALIITLYVLCQLLFNLGPNTLTFIIPAEIFPTRYRGTCHGISAAAGKAGSIVVQAFLPSAHVANPNSYNLAWVLIGFSFAMALGAVVTWAWVPEVQDARGTETERRRGKKSKFNQYVIPSKSLEDLAVGRIGVTDEARMVGFRKKGSNLISRSRNGQRDSQKTEV